MAYSGMAQKLAPTQIGGSAWGLAHFLLGVAAFFGLALGYKRRPWSEVFTKERASGSLGWGLPGFAVGLTHLTWYPVALVDLLLRPLEMLTAPVAWGLLGGVVGFTISQARADSAAAWPDGAPYRLPRLSRS